MRSIVDRQSSVYKANYAAMQAALERLRAELRRSTEGGGEKYVRRRIERGKLLPRERVEMLLDEGSYFLEIAPLAGIGMENESPGAGVIGGIGLVCGRECLVTANEATLKGGATSEAGLWKNGRLADIARQNHLPSILLVESAGADLPVQSKIFVAGWRTLRAKIISPEFCWWNPPALICRCKANYLLPEDAAFARLRAAPKNAFPPLPWSLAAPPPEALTCRGCPITPSW